MIKYLKIFLLAVAVVGIMSGSAFAVAALNAGNTKVAAELISPTVDYTALIVNTAYETGGPVAASTTLKISLTNAKFEASPAGIVICEMPGGTTKGSSGAIAANATSVNITLVEPLASAGTVYTIQPVACAAPAPTALDNIAIPAGSVNGTVSSMSIDSVTVPGDPNVVATANISTVLNQFSAILAPVTSKLDFATLQKTFIPSGPSPLPNTSPFASQAAITLISDETIPVANKVLVTYPAACAGVIGALDSVVIKISGDLKGLLDVRYDGVTSTTIAAADITAGAKTLTLTGAQVLICSSSDSPKVAQLLALDAVGPTGTDSIATGTRTAQVTLKGGAFIPTGYSRDLVAAGTSSHTFQLDATQYYVQLIKFGIGVETFIKLQSKSTVVGSGGVNASILADDGTLVPFSAGNIVAGTPFTITGADLATAVVAAGKTVSPTQGFAAVITVNAPIADVFGYANTCDPSGCKRIPLKIGYTASSGTFIVE